MGLFRPVAGQLYLLFIMPYWLQHIQVRKFNSTNLSVGSEAVAADDSIRGTYGFTLPRSN
jgi:hypothetical protein